MSPETENSRRKSNHGRNTWGYFSQTGTYMKVKWKTASCKDVEHIHGAMVQYTRWLHFLPCYKTFPPLKFKGEFRNGYPTGKGKMILSELSTYNGDVCMGYFHGEGVLNVASTPMIYKGHWRNGKRHGMNLSNNINHAPSLYQHVCIIWTIIHF